MILGLHPSSWAEGSCPERVAGSPGRVTRSPRRVGEGEESLGRGGGGAGLRGMYYGSWASSSRGSDSASLEKRLVSPPRRRRRRRRGRLRRRRGWSGRSGSRTLLGSPQSAGRLTWDSGRLDGVTRVRGEEWAGDSRRQGRREWCRGVWYRGRGCKLGSGGEAGPRRSGRGPVAVVVGDRPRVKGRGWATVDGGVGPSV